jgi:hypothetical protein
MPWTGPVERLFQSREVSVTEIRQLKRATVGTNHHGRNAVMDCPYLCAIGSSAEDIVENPARSLIGIP